MAGWISERGKEASSITGRYLDYNVGRCGGLMLLVGAFLTRCLAVEKSIV